VAARARRRALTALAAPQVFGPTSTQKDLYEDAIVPTVDEARLAPSVAPALPNV